MRLASVSVDLDEIANYFAIHGLADASFYGLPREPPQASDPDPNRSLTLVYDVAIDRLMAWAKTESLPITFFAIGKDLERKASATKLAQASDAGHEIANHSYGHRYDLTRLSRVEMENELSLASDLIYRATSVRPVGFRAPGYTVNEELLNVVRDLGFAYDSSVFPCPIYFALKSAKIAFISAAGRSSQSIVDDPRVLLAPTRPYRMGSAYHRRGEGLLELPIQVTRGARLPFIGTFVTMAGSLGARTLARMCVGEPLVNFELHGIDVLDSDDGLQKLAPHQPDVRIPWQRKVATLSAAVAALKQAGYTFQTLRAAAAKF